MTLSVAATRELLCLAFAAGATHFALHSATPATTGNQLGTRVAITWDSVTSVTVLPGTATPANKLDANVVTIALAATTAAPYGAWWSASTAGIMRETVLLSFPSGAARNVDVDPSYYQA